MRIFIVISNADDIFFIRIEKIMETLDIPGQSNTSPNVSSLSRKLCHHILDDGKDALVNSNQALVRKRLVDKGFRETLCQNPWWERLSAHRQFQIVNQPRHPKPYRRDDDEITIMRFRHLQIALPPDRDVVGFPAASGEVRLRFEFNP